MTRATYFKGDSELRLSQERAKYAMLGGSKVVVGISIASTSDVRIMVLWRSAAAPPHIPYHHTSHYDSPRDLPKWF